MFALKDDEPAGTSSGPRLLSCSIFSVARIDAKVARRASSFARAAMTNNCASVVRASAVIDMATNVSTNVNPRAFTSDDGCNHRSKGDRRCPSLFSKEKIEDAVRGDESIAEIAINRFDTMKSPIA